ncbi:MAG TPA: NADH-quinone oxidoreductase subunit NuoF [Methanomassiliicoccales archaeon]|nr:NADH-quinone oxidoreductase subunit NuoF [Methanomassiliicoccales archaeon]
MRLYNLQELEALRQSIIQKKDPNKPRISVCSGTGCSASGEKKVHEAFRDELKKLGAENRVEVKTTGCPGPCQLGPIVVLYPEGTFYHSVKAEQVPDIVEKTVLKGEVLEDLLYTDPATNRKVFHEKDVPFYAKQMRNILGNNGLLEPASIEDYIGLGGFAALAKVLGEMRPDQVIDLVKKAGLRGRGGAGFPTGLKWEAARRSSGNPKYVVCNADEGDPGAYMNRSVLEGNPFSVLEGMIIGAYAIGSIEGYFYVRAEYPLAVKNIILASKKARERGILGKNILGSGFDFDVKVVKGAGAFVCGEETAMMASIEGKRGMPRPRPPFPAESGIWGKPTNINNVETWANIPLLIRNGVDWYQGIGSRTSKGTKVFSLVGKIKNTGLVEVPMGTSLRTIVFDIGGGIPNGKALKAVQCGGPSGGCIPASKVDVPMDYEGLKELGAMMGSGGLIVMDEDTCMVDMAKYFVTFTQSESCGKCVPCRIGTKRMLEILERITQGEGMNQHIADLESLSTTIRDGSLCGLGQTAPNPVLTTLMYFRDEYEAHINEKRCPAKVCKALIHFEIDKDKCIGCQACKVKCPAKAIDGQPKKPHEIDQSLCIKCGVCQQTCPPKASAVQRLDNRPEGAAK